MLRQSRKTDTVLCPQSIWHFWVLEDKLPETFKEKIITLATPYAPLDGINEKGLTVAVLRIGDEPTNQDTGKVDIMTTTAIRLMLDKAADVEEALALLEQYDMHSSAGACYHFQISDARGKSVVVEYVDNEYEVIPAENNYQMVTNFLLSDKNIILEVVRIGMRF